MLFFWERVLGHMRLLSPIIESAIWTLVFVSLVPDSLVWACPWAREACWRGGEKAFVSSSFILFIKRQSWRYCASRRCSRCTRNSKKNQYLVLLNASCAFQGVFYRVINELSIFLSFMLSSNYMPLISNAVGRTRNWGSVAKLLTTSSLKELL